MTTVTAVRVDEWEKDGATVKTYYLTLDSGKTVPCYNDKASVLKPGDPLPDGWEVKVSKRGKEYVFVPDEKRGGAPAAFRNTREGFFAEQSFMNARTALMQAVTLHETHSDPNAENVIGWADSFYEWLRKTSGAGRAAGDSKALPAPDETSVTAVGADKPEGQASPLNGEAAGEPVPSAPNELWDKAREIGLSPPKAVVMARRRGWDHVRTSTDLSDAQLAELILIRKEELA